MPNSIEAKNRRRRQFGTVAICYAAVCLLSCGDGGSSGDRIDGTANETATSPGGNTGGGSSPPPAPTPTPTPTVAVPAGYTIKQAVGIRCDGSTDDTAAIQSNLNALGSYQALQLPDGTCLTSNILILQGKSEVMVLGAGKDSTIIKAADASNSSITLTGDSSVVLRGFQILGQATKRIDNGNAFGIYVQKSSNVTIDSVKVVRVAGAGILFAGVNDGVIQNSEVNGSLADGFHVTGGSQNVIVQNNLANAVGDDAYASIGYAASGRNQNISFLNNVAQDGRWAGGIDFSGTQGGSAISNKIYRSGIGCIEVNSNGSYKTVGNDQINLQNNYCEGNVTRTDTGHGVIMLYVTYPSGYVHGVTGSNNVIVNPASGAGIRAFGYSSTSDVQASFTNTTMTGVATPFAIGDYASVAR